MSKPQEAVTYRDLLAQAIKALADTSSSPKIDAETLLQHATKQSSAWLIAHNTDFVTFEESENYFELIERRAKGEPIAYILGYKEFWSLKLIVNQHVLIPRADTETLVEQALLKLDTQKKYNILDLGTGSGAIALAIAKERPRAQVIAVDSQSGALEVAKINARVNEIENVRFIQSDWFDEIPAIKFNLIASNPPYVEANDSHLEQGDLRFEPNSALIGGGDGLDDLKKIILIAPSFLAKGAHLLLEHGFDQHKLVENIMLDAGFTNIENTKDINGLPRCTAGEWLGYP